MTAVASPQPEILSQRPEGEHLSNYVNAQFRQPLVQQHPRQAQSSSTSLRQEPPPRRGQERQRADLSGRRTNSRNSGSSNLSRGTNAQRTPSSGQSDEFDDAASPRPNVQLTRANTDYGPRRHPSVVKHDVLEENWELRHGWEDQYNSTEYLGLLSSVSSFRLCLILPRRTYSRSAPD